MSSASKKKRVLITGATGFTGKHLCRFLGGDPSLELYLSGISVAPQPCNFTPCDFLDPSAVARVIEKVKPDQMYHLIGSYTNNYEKDYASNVLSTRNIFDAVRRAKKKSRILLVGSSAEYGFPENPALPVKETHPLRPVSIYGLMKVYQNMLMGTYVRLYDMDIVAVRPFNLKGTGIPAVLFTGKMYEEIQKYKREEIKRIETGDLSVERDYIDIDEAIKYYRMVLERGKTGEVYNVGSGKASSLREVLRGMLEESGLSMNIVREGKHEIPGKIVVPKIFSDITKVQSL